MICTTYKAKHVLINKDELEVQIAEDLEKVQNYDMHEAYNTNEMDYGTKKDADTILILGISEAYNTNDVRIRRMKVSILIPIRRGLICVLVAS